MKNFKELKVWQKSLELVIDIYRVTEKFPKRELYGLVSQVCRSSVSIPSNIAEGYGRQSDPEFQRFLNIAKGSLYEMQTQIEICLRLKYLNEPDYQLLNDNSIEVDKMINGLIKYLNRQKS